MHLMVVTLMDLVNRVVPTLALPGLMEVDHPIPLQARIIMEWDWQAIIHTDPKLTQQCRKEILDCLETPALMLRTIT